MGGAPCLGSPWGRGEAADVALRMVRQGDQGESGAATPASQGSWTRRTKRLWTPQRGSPRDSTDSPLQPPQSWTCWALPGPCGQVRPPHPGRWVCSRGPRPTLKPPGFSKGLVPLPASWATCDVSITTAEPKGGGSVVPPLQGTERMSDSHQNPTHTPALLTPNCTRLFGLLASLLKRVVIRVMNKHISWTLFFLGRPAETPHSNLIKMISLQI